MVLAFQSTCPVIATHSQVPRKPQDRPLIMLYNSFCWPAFQDSPLMVWNETTLQHHNTLILTGSLGLFFFLLWSVGGGGRGLSSCNRKPLQGERSVKLSIQIRYQKKKMLSGSRNCCEVKGQIHRSFFCATLYENGSYIYITPIDRHMLHRDRNRSGWSGHGQAILSRS